MAEIKKIIEEILLEHSVDYPIPSLNDKEQIDNLMDCCDRLGYSEYKQIISETFLNKTPIKNTPIVKTPIVEEIKEEVPQPKVEEPIEEEVVETIIETPSFKLEYITIDQLLESLLIEEEGKGESKEFPGKYHLGGGYYSSKQGGDAQFKNDNGNLRPVTPEEKAEFDKKASGGEEQKPEEKPTEKPVEKPEVKPTTPTAEKPSTSQQPTEQPVVKPEMSPEDKQKEDRIKNEPEKVLNDPEASAKDRARARAFKSEKDNLKTRRENDPEYQTELKKDVQTKLTDISKELRDQTDSDGNRLDSEITENGSILIGVEHGDDTETTKNIIDKITSLPKDAKVVFVGEGGSSYDENGRIEFNGEQKEIRDAYMNHFDSPKEESWDENADITDSDSQVFEHIANTFGGDKQKAMASIWTNMVGQGDDLNAEDYLTDETKQWIVDQAKKGGSDEFNEDIDWNNLSLEQKEDLYQLNYRDDQNYGETELSAGQKAYNDFRQKELDRKIKEIEKTGGIAIATMGNSHVAGWRERNAPKKDTFNPSSLRTLGKEMPEADKDVFNKSSDINKIPEDKKKEISMKIDELADKANKGEDFNLCQITVPGTNLYCDDNQGIPREEMPQFKGKPLPGTPAESMPKDSKGEVDTEPLFKKMLKEKGIKTIETEVPSDKLKATQSELVGSKVAGMTKALEEDPNNPGITAPIYVSRDGFVIDGHHRWAAVTSNAIKAGKPANMKVIVVDMDIKDAIPMCNKFAEEQGIAAKKADANDGNLPKPKKADETPNSRVYNVGGNYYSDTPNGPAQYIKTESVIEKIFIEEDIAFFNLIFETVVTKTDGNDNPIKLTVIDPKDQPKATQKADAIDNQDNGNSDTEVQSLDTMLSGIEDTTNNKATKEKVKQASESIIRIFDILANNSNNPHSESHKKAKELLQKMFNGEALTQEEKDFLHKFIRIAQPTIKKPNAAKFYIAREPNNFKGSGKNKRDKIALGGDKGGNSPVYGAFRDFAEKGGLSQMSTSTFGTKLTTANQTFVDEAGKTKLIKGENGKPLASIDKDTNGNITSVNIGATKITRLDENEPNITEEEKKKRQRNNRNMDEYSKAIEKGDLQFIDMDNGVSPDTPENRVIVIKGALSGMASRLRDLAKKEGIDDDRINTLINQLEAFSERDPNETPKQWFKDLNAMMSSIANDEGEPSLKECWANYAEVYSAIVEMHDGGNGTENGACALLPESTTLETVDVITINTNGVGDRKIVTLDGKSVKKGVGGASALTSKTEKSTYIDDPDGTKKEAIIALSKTHDDIYRMKLDEPMDAHVSYQNEYRDNLKNKAAELGVSDKYIFQIEDNLKEPNNGWKSVNAAIEQIKQSREKVGKAVDAETMQKIRMRLESYYMYGHLAHESYNANVDVQDFSNDSILSQADDRGGSELVRNKDIKIDSSDGVNILAYPRFEFNIGRWGEEGRSGNAGAGRFHNLPKRGEYVPKSGEPIKRVRN